jgi:hypothetical protein
VRNVCHQLREQGVFRHASAADVDERGSFVVITYVDPTVVEVQRSRPSNEMVPIPPPRRLALPQHPAPIYRPFYRRWQFGLGVVISILVALFGAGYWVVQQLKQVDAPEVGAGVVGFLFVSWIAWMIVKAIFGGGGGKGHGGGYGFHYGPCD